MSGYGPLYWPWSCFPVAADAGQAYDNSNSSSAVAAVEVAAAVITTPDERILQTATGEPGAQVMRVTCRTVAAVVAVVAATVVAVVTRLPRSSQVTTIIGRERSAHATGRVSLPNTTPPMPAAVRASPIKVTFGFMPLSLRFRYRHRHWLPLRPRRRSSPRFHTYTCSRLVLLHGIDVTVVAMRHIC